MRRKDKNAFGQLSQRIIRACGVLLATGAGFAFARSAAAVDFFDPSGTLGLVNVDLIVLVVNILQWVLGLLGLVAVGFIIYGGIVWMTSGGNEEKIERAKRIIVNSVIGLVLVLLSWAIVFFVTGTLNNLSGGGNTNAPCPTCGGPGLPGLEFRVANITTSCQDGLNYREDVAQCSNIQVTFNHLLDIQTVKDAVVAEKMILESCGTLADGSNLDTCGNPTKLFGVPNVYDDDGVLPASGGDGVWLSSNNTATFYHPNSLLPGGDDAASLEQYYRLRIPRDLKDAGGLNLSECKDNFGRPILGCKVETDEITWIFWVGLFVDTEPPAIARSYPIFDATDPAYPDRSVNRSPIIWAEFDEPVDGNWLANDTTVELYACADGQPCTAKVEFSDADYKVVSRGGIGFELQLIAPALFESFTWYKIVVDNFTDLCSNVMTPKPTEWVFQTNDVAPGVLQVYPPNDWPNACPNIQPFVQFTTSMYNIDTGSCKVDQTNGVVTGVTPWEARDLTIVDDYVSGDPNAFCKQYSFAGANDLSLGTKNTQTVTTKMVYDADGHTVTVPDASRIWPFQTWEFGVVDYTAGCVNPPYLTRVEPASGGVGQCVTVYGGNIGEGLNVGGPLGKADVLEVGGDEADDYSKDSWFPWAIIGRIPSLPQGKKTIDVTEYFPAIDFDTTVSSPFQFEVTGASGGGPCLYSIFPNPQAKGATTTFLGSAFDPVSLTKELNFTGAPGNPPILGTWADTSAQVTVPSSAVTGNATVKNDNGLSNPQLFVVAPPGVPLMEFSSSCALARYPSPNPQYDQTNVCPNAQYVHAAFTLDMDDASLKEPHNIYIQECSDPDCLKFANSPLVPARIEVSEPLNAPGEGLNFILKQSLKLSTTYKVTIATNIKSAEGAPLPGDALRCGPGIAYCWKFTTDAKDCVVDALALDPQNKTTDLVNTDFPYTAWTYSKATCMPVNAPANFDPWTPNSDPYGFFPTKATGSTPTNKLRSGPGPAEGTANLSVRETFTGLTAAGTFTLDLTSCEDTAQCVRNCGATSQCIQTASGGKCTPVIKDIQGNPGPVGGWVYVDTACAGPYVAGESKVTFTGPSGEIDGKPLLQCLGGPAGWTWVEVPDDATPTPSDDAIDGAVKVYSTAWGTGRKNDFSSDSTKTGVGPYDVDSTKTNHMVCRVDPLVQTKGDDYLLYGNALGDGTGPSDKVQYEDSGVKTRYDSADLTWKADEIKAVTPTDPAAPTNLWYNAFAILNGKDSLSSAAAFIRPPGPGDPCDSDLTNAPICDPDNGLCGWPGSGLQCDLETCTCQPLGECSDTPAPTCTANPSICQTKYGPASTCDTTSCFCTVPNFACSKDKYSCVVNPTGCSAGYSCDTGCACQPIDLSVVKTDPSHGENNVCKNRSISVEFSVPVDLASFTGNVLVEYDPLDGMVCSGVTMDDSFGQRLASRIRKLFGVQDTEAAAACSATNSNVSYGRSTSEVIIDPFPSVPTLRYADYKITLGQNIRAQNGDTLGANFMYGFKTKDELCDASRVEIDVKFTPASSDLFTCKGDTCAGDDDSGAVGNQHNYQSVVYDDESHMLKSDHTWQDSATPGAVNLTSTGCTATVVCALNGTVNASSADGTERVTVTGKAGNGTARAALDVTTLACDDPWPDKPPYKDYASGGQWFEMYYCQDTGLPNLMPHDPTDPSTPVSDGNFTTDPTNGTDELLREIFLPVEGMVGDVIGIRIMENEQHLDPLSWYTKQFGGSRSGAASLTVDGYEAAQIGRSVYVNAPHYVAGSGLYTNIYILSYNEGAGSDTVGIFGELLKTIRFNMEPGTMPALACNGGTDMNRDCVRRDTARFADVVEMINLLNEFKVNNGQYPAVGSGENFPGGSGSFVEGITTSRWPLSWSALGNSVGRALPSDPVNEFKPACGVSPYPNHDASTCWDETNHKYVCPSDSKIYQFITENQGKSASLYNRFEYEGTYSWKDPPSGDPCSFAAPDATCRCFNSEFLDADWGAFLTGKSGL